MKQTIGMNTKNSGLLTGMLALSLALMFGISTTQAQSQPSAKVTAKTADLVLLPLTNGTGGWQTILANNIKTANQKDLFIGASLEIGLFTETLTKSKNLQTDTSIANAQVDVQVLIDGVAAEPGTVVYGRRSQTLSATLEGAIAGCLSLVTNLDGTTSIVVDTNCVAPETIELILESTDAATFNFVAEDVPVGVHTVAVQARIVTSATFQAGTAQALATVGKGTMTAESVRLIKDPNVPIDVP
jgi:hypothetical protein